MSFGVAQSAHALSTGCTTLNSFGTSAFGTTFTPSVTLAAGEVVSFRVITGGPITWTSPSAVVTAIGQTATFTVATTGPVTFTATSPLAGTFFITCVGTSSPQALSQNIANAQTAVTNGQQALRTMSDWIGRTISSSFGSGSTGTAAAPGAKLTAHARLERLQREERDLAEERLSLAASRVPADLDLRLKAMRRDVAFARLTARLAPDRVAPDERAAGQYSQPTDPATGQAAQNTAVAPSLSLNSRDLADYCGGPEVCDGVDRRWNVWLEGRVIGATDSLAQSSALGFLGNAGADYKVLPWLAAGLTVGVENFQTKFGTLGLGSGSTGLTAAPYVGFKLDDNVFLSVFTGVTSLNYSTTPAVGVAAQFGSLRWFGGAALTGVWREGPWRFQPTLSGTYATERQNGYTDSSGTVVSALNVDYGRLSAGPEVGYVLWRSDAWSLEPFVLAKFNVDFTSSNVTALNGVSVTLRPGTLASGSAGGGVNLRFESGVNVRAEASYESIGVTGLDVWTGTLRGTLPF